MSISMDDWRGLTVDRGNEVGLLLLPILNTSRYSHQGIHRDVVDAALQVELEVLSFVAEELPVVHDDADLFRQEARCSP